MSKLLKNSLTWMLCAKFAALWRSSLVGSFLIRLFCGQPKAEASAYQRTLTRWNGLLYRFGQRIKPSVTGSITYGLYGKLLGLLRGSVLIGRAFSGGITTLLLVIIAAYTPIDYFLRDGIQLTTVASLWDEALILFGFLWVLYQRTTEQKIGRANTMDVYLGFYMITGIVLLIYTVSNLGVNITGYRASMQYILLFFVVSRLIRNDEDFLLMYRVMIAIAFLFSVHAIWQFIVGTEIPEEWTDQAEQAVRTRAFSIFSNPNILGGYMVLFAPMAIGVAYASRDRATKIFYWICGICMCAACLFTMSRGAWMALAVAAVLFSLIVDRRLFLLLLVGGVAACFLPFVRSRIGYLFTEEFAESNARGGRAKRWATGIGYLTEYDAWIGGMGYGIYGGAVAVQNQINPALEYMYVDNYYVKILVENGIVGITAFGTSILGLLFNGARACVRTSGTQYRPMCAGMLTGLIGVLLHSIFESLWEEPYMMAIFFAVVGMLIYIGFHREKK